MPARRCTTPTDGLQSQVDPSSGRPMFYATPEAMQDYKNEGFHYGRWFQFAMKPGSPPMAKRCPNCKHFKLKNKRELRGKCQHRGHRVGPHTCCNMWERQPE